MVICGIDISTELCNTGPLY